MCVCEFCVICRGVDMRLQVCECAQKPYVVPDQVQIYPDRRGVDMRLQCV